MNRTILYHYWRSSASWRVRWALAIKGVAFETVVVDIREGAQRADAHRARNPIGHVPALEIDGHVFAESVAIMEYLDETIPSPPLYPKQPLARARVRQIVELVNAGIQPLQNLVALERAAPGDPAGQKAWAAHFNERGLGALEALLAGFDRERGDDGPFAYGASLTAADLALVPQVYSARRFGVDPARFPRVLAAERAALATEHARGALPENQPGAPKEG